MARPRSRTQTQDEELFNRFKKYIDNTTLPIIAEFAYMNEIGRNYLYDNAIFSTLLKRCIAKKEDRKSTRLNSSHSAKSRMPSSA